LRADVSTTLMFAPGPMDLTTLAQRIAVVTQIPVHVRPDALLPLERFLPRLQQVGQVSAPVKASAMVTLAGGPEPLARILDRIGAQLGVMWRYHQDRIEFYRTETRVFNVRALALNASA